MLMIKDKNDFITLKEAAELTGYSSDYIGQLIRSGKLPGKQIYTNVSWMTTREALIQYSQKDRKDKTNPAARPTFLERLQTPETLTTIYTIVGWIVVTIFSVFILFFAYIVAVSIDHRINSNYLEKVEYAR